MYDYKCTNKECTEFDKEIERICSVSKASEQTCEACQQKLKKLFSKTKFPKHSSWSTWYPPV